MPNYTNPSPGQTEEEVQESTLLHNDGFAPGFAG